MEQKQIENLLDSFRAAVLADAEKEREEKQAAFAAAKAKATQEAREKALADSLEKVQRETSAEQLRITRALNDKKFQVKKALLRRRMEIEKAVSDEVEVRISTYTKSEEYRTSLKRQFKNTNLAMLSDKVTVVLPEKDQGERTLIEQFLPHAKFETDPSIHFGGCKVEDRKKHILLDYTIDSNMAHAMERFLEISGLGTEIQ